MKKRAVWLSLLAVMAVCCVCALALGGAAMWPRQGVTPSVQILHPPSGTQIALNARVPVLVQAEVESGRLRRVQLYADAQLIGNLPSKADSLQALWNWTALSPGDHTLVAQAVSAEGKTSSASVRLQVVEAADRDGDGIPDEQDRCPEQTGSLEAEGCPTATSADRDGDGVADDQDRCPEEAGLVDESGCPRPADRDGDGLRDDADRCADEPGPVETEGCPTTTVDDRDGDGIRDGVDVCPDEGGTLDSGGCPPAVSGDRDGDGVSDERDSCPDLAGDEEHDGCPFVTEEDRDGDGIADDVDSCPDEPGGEALSGCPPHVPPGGMRGFVPICLWFPAICEAIEATIDTDGDGVVDIEDRCPEEYGPPASDGCPIRIGWHDRELWGALSLCRFNPAACGLDPGREVEITVELAENLYTDRDWLAVWCYFRGGEGDWYRLPLEGPSLRRRDPRVWYLGDHRSVTLSSFEHSLLSVRAFCQALEMPFGEPVSLGEIVRVYGISDWTRIPFIIWSEGAANRFMIIFTLSCDGCE
jgi:hypothetical protein